MEKNVGELEKEQNCLEWKEAAAGSDSTHELYVIECCISQSSTFYQ